MFHFGKRAKAPLSYNILRYLGEISDGITGLLMLPFNRYGTSFALDMCEKTLIWQIKKSKENRKNDKSI